MTSEEIRQSFLEFFEKKGHVIIPSASLIPENDPTTLFTGSGMQPMLRYLLGEKHPLGKRIVDIQKCFRSQDIEEVGNNRHTTFFEMLGNWSLGDFFKKEQIIWMFEFLTKEIGLEPGNLYVTVFRGNEKLGLPRDEESVKIWQEVFVDVGMEARVVDFAERDGMRDGRIFYYDEKKNWWSRVGVPDEMPMGEPGGVCSEMFWDFGIGLKFHENSKFKNQLCHVNCDCGRFLEIGNNVFMEYIKTENGFSSLPQKNVDFGGGLERIIAAKNNNPDIFETDIFKPLILKIQESASDLNIGVVRILADHLRASIFLIADGVRPSNKEAGYILRRLLRRILAYQIKYNIHADLFPKSVEIVKEKFGKIYPEVKETRTILKVIEEEKQKFQGAIREGIKKIDELNQNGVQLAGQTAFYLYQTHGLPLEISQELAKRKATDIKEDFNKEFEKHQEISRAGAEKKFGGHGIEISDVKGQLSDVVKLHTATHLLNAALRLILRENVLQKGSNITSERLRFDFSYPQKMSAEQIKQVKDLINEKIKEDLPVICEEMNLEDAKNQGAMGVFDQKYGERVKVYTIGNSATGDFFSKEICGGPHVNRTLEIGKFKILKEEAVGAGIRRIRATIES